MRAEKKKGDEKVGSAAETIKEDKRQRDKRQGKQEVEKERVCNVIPAQEL